MKEEFMDRIIKYPKIIDCYSIIKKENLPLYIYGAGNLAEIILRRLTEHKINITGCITDTGLEKFHEYPVISFEDMNKTFGVKSCNIILGFAAAYRREKELEKHAAIHKIFQIANPFEHHKHFDIKFVLENTDMLYEAYQLFSDKKSQNCFCAFINSRICEDSSFIVSLSEKDIDEFNNDVMFTTNNEVFLDIGAYTGGSINRFLKSSNYNVNKIIGIEPEEKNFNLLKDYVQRNKIKNIKLHKIGCWYKKDRLLFNAEDDKCCRLDKTASTYIEVDAIDNICGHNDNISILNLGISTAEVEIIQGARMTIERCLPKLVIFMGSAKEELYLIPKLINEINPNYKIYLRFQSSMASRLFLYAIPECEVNSD